MSQFAKVTVDSAHRNRSPFPLGGHVSTSFQFGEVAPVHCRKLTANSSSTVNVRSLVRLDPMVAPTSQGVIKCKQWHSFIGMSDLFRNYAAFQTGTVINGSNGTVNFDKLPRMRLCDLSAFCLVGCQVTPYVKDTTNSDEETAYWQRFSDDYTAYFNALYSKYEDFISDSADVTFDAAFPNFTQQGYNYHIDLRSLGLNITGSGNAYIPLGNTPPIAGASLRRREQTFFLGADVDIAHCDFVFYNTFTDDGETYNFAFAVNMSNYGRRIFNILNVLGIGVDFASTDFADITRLFAYYLSYFGSFGLTKYTNYEQRICKICASTWV